MVDQLNSFATEVVRISQMVGRDGILDQQITVDGVQGVWAELTQNVNSMAKAITLQVRGVRHGDEGRLFMADWERRIRSRPSRRPLPEATFHSTSRSSPRARWPTSRPPSASTPLRFLQSS